MPLHQIQLTRGPAASPGAGERTTIEPLLLTTARVLTFDGPRPLTNATGFFFRRNARVFLITSRHVVIDESSFRPESSALVQRALRLREVARDGALVLYVPAGQAAQP